MAIWLIIIPFKKRARYSKLKGREIDNIGLQSGHFYVSNNYLSIFWQSGWSIAITLPKNNLDSSICLHEISIKLFSKMLSSVRLSN